MLCFDGWRVSGFYARFLPVPSRRHAVIAPVRPDLHEHWCPELTILYEAMRQEIDVWVNHYETFYGVKSDLSLNPSRQP